MDIHLICVGQLKSPHLQAIQNDYLKRIKSPSLFIHHVKNYPQDKEREGKGVVKKLTSIHKDTKNSFIVLLSENGKDFTSEQFAKYLTNQAQKYRSLIMLLGGALGHAQAVEELADAKISLSKMTFPHKLAKIIVIEQIYRAQCITAGHPYHN